MAERQDSITVAQREGGDYPAPPVVLNWEGLEDASTPVSTNALRVRVISAWHDDVFVRLRVACHGLLEETKYTELGELWLAPGKAHEVDVPSADIPVQSSAHVLQLQAEAVYATRTDARGRAVLSRVVYYRFGADYGSAAFSYREEAFAGADVIASQPARSAEFNLFGRVKTADGRFRTLAADDEEFVLRDSNGVAVGRVLSNGSSALLGLPEEAY